MGRDLLIVGAGMYAVVASEIAADMGCFEKIDFVDDVRQTTPNGVEVVGTIQEMGKKLDQYDDVIVAIGNPQVRLSLLDRLKREKICNIVTLISPRAYVSKSAHVMCGCIIEPMAVVHTECSVGEGCIISAGAVLNHMSVCCDGVHVDCNATVAGYAKVPSCTKIANGDVFCSE